MLVAFMPEMLYDDTIRRNIWRRFRGGTERTLPYMRFSRGGNYYLIPSWGPEGEGSVAVFMSEEFLMVRAGAFRARHAVACYANGSQLGNSCDGNRSTREMCGLWGVLVSSSSSEAYACGQTRDKVRGPRFSVRADGGEMCPYVELVPCLPGIFYHAPLTAFLLYTFARLL